MERAHTYSVDGGTYIGVEGGVAIAQPEGSKSGLAIEMKR